MSFVIRKLNDAETLGQKLKALRLASQRTLSEMAETCKIRKGYLDALENDRFDQLPAPLYTRNFLRIYVSTMGGDVTYFLERFDAERGTCDFTKAARLPVRRRRAMEFIVASRFVKFGALGLVAIAIVSYLGSQLVAITAPPELVILSPADGLQTPDAIVRVSGQVEDEATVRVNGIDVLLGPDGTFETEVALERGLNVITVEGAKRYSRSATEFRRVIFGQPLTAMTSSYTQTTP